VLLAAELSMLNAWKNIHKHYDLVVTILRLVQQKI